MTYPENDTNFEDVDLVSVEKSESGFAVQLSSGWHFFIPNPCPFEPKAGDKARLYGSPRVRGVFVNGVKFYYRTEAAEQIERDEHERYGSTPQDVIDMWDQGKSIWSIEMGGIGPGYEQAIQVCAIEVLRQVIADAPAEQGYAAYSESLHDKLKERIAGLGLSGAQWGAALNIAFMIYKKGPREFHRSIPKDRRILVSNHWPRIEKAA